MRTKHLLTAIVLPSLFAACTADELVKTDNGAAEDLSMRPVVEGVTLNLGGADTKAIVPEGGNFNTIQYESTDKVGALLIDQLGVYDKNAPIGSYSLMADKFNTNYEFKNVGGASFASEAYLVEGNYVFYYPYNGQRTRDKMLTNLPKTQKLAKDANCNWSNLHDVIEKSEDLGAPIAIGYDFIAKSDENKTANADMKQIYAIPQFTIQNYYTVQENVNGNNVTVEKSFKVQEIELRYGANGNFTLSAPLKFATGGNTAWEEAENGAAKSTVNVLFNEELPANADADDYNQAGYWLESKPYADKVRATSDVIGGAEPNGTSKVIKVTLEEPVEVAYGEAFSFYAVIPAEAYTATNKLKLTVVNSDGLSKEIELGEATLYPARRYPIEEYAAGNPNTDLAGSALTANVEGFDALGGVRVSTVEELINTIKNYNVIPAGELKIITTGTAVINQRVAQFLNATTTKATKITFVNAVDFEGAGVSLTPKKPVTFEDGATVKAGANVTIVEGTPAIEMSAGKKLAVVAGGSLSLGKNSFAATSIVENSGVLAVTGTQAAKIVNFATMNASDATLSAEFNNGKNDGSKAAVLNVIKGKSLTIGDASSKNHLGATINNLGTLNGGGNLTSNGIVNNGAADNSTADASGFTNSTSGRTGAAKATVNNYGDLAVTNNAIVNMMSENAKAIVTGSGRVNNDVLAIVNNTGNKVYYTMTGNCSEIPDYLAANQINTLILKDCVLSLNEDAPNYTTAVTMDVEVEGTTTIAGKTGANAKQVVKITSGKTLTIAKNATLNVQATAKITSNGVANGIVIKNYGTVNNQGIVSDVDTYDKGNGATWNYNPYEVHVSAASTGTLVVNKEWVYRIDRATAITGVTANGTVDAESSQPASMTKTVFAGLTGKLTVGSYVTLTVGATDDNDGTLDASATAVAGVTAWSELTSGLDDDEKAAVIAELKKVFNPGDSATKIIAGGGTIKAQFKIKVGDGTPGYVLATWTSGNWNFAVGDLDNDLELP